MKAASGALPYFWYFVIMNSNGAAQTPPTDADAHVLQYLTRVSVTDLDAREIAHSYVSDERSLRVRYTVACDFAPNAYLALPRLTKTIEFTSTASDRRDISVTSSVARP